MKKLLPHICACLIIGIGFFVASEIFAQAPDAKVTAPTQAKPGAAERFFYSALEGTVKWIAFAILQFFIWLTSITGLLLNMSIDWLIIGMGDMVRTKGFGIAIDKLWTIIRDIVNICFVFGLVYIGITTIVKSEASGAKRLLSSLIISALLVNFSLFFTKAIIDLSNITADNIYRQMITGSSKDGISGEFVSQMGLTSIVGGGKSKQSEEILNKVLAEGGGIPFMIVFALGSGILLFKLAFAFGIGAFLILIRFVMLILLMIFSPIAFLPEVLPNLGKYRQQWWDTLLSQAFFAPIYIFGIYLSLIVLRSNPVALGDRNLINLFTESAVAGTVQVLLFYLIAIIMIIATTTMAKSMSTSGASIVGKISEGAAKYARKTVGKTIAGASVAGGIVGRNTVGRVGYNLSKKEGLLKAAAGGGLTGWAARRAVDTTRAAAKGSFDARALPGMKGAAGLVDVDLGKPGKGSYEARTKDINKKELEYAESLNVEKGADVEKVKHKIDGHKTYIKEKQRDYNLGVKNGASETEKQKIRDEIAIAKSELEDANRELIEVKSANQRKYAKTLQDGQLGFMGLPGTSIFPARTKKENAAAANHIREGIEKKKNKTDTDRLIDATKESAEKASKNAKEDAH